MNSIGIDFGTTNTVLAFADANGTVRAQTFDRGGEVLEAVRTTLSIRRNIARGEPPAAEAGPWAIEDFVEAPEDTRFLQSFKSFAASPSFTDTAIFTRRFQAARINTGEQLLSIAKGLALVGRSSDIQRWPVKE